MRQYTGVLHALQPNKPDGVYPREWRKFFVNTGTAHVVFEARTGGERDKLLTMARKVVTIQGSELQQGVLAEGDPDTVKLAFERDAVNDN